MDPACRIHVASALRVALLVTRLCARARGSSVHMSYFKRYSWREVVFALNFVRYFLAKYFA